MKNLLKDKIHELVGKRAKQDPAVVASVLKAFEEMVTAQLIKGNKVTLTGFVSFEPQARKAREGRNPRTGDKIEIGAFTAVAVKAGNTLKKAVKAG